MNKEYNASFEIKDVSAKTLPEFIEKVKELSQRGKEISNIVAVVVTVKSL